MYLSRYKELRDSDKEDFRQKMKVALLGLEIEEEEDSYEIILKQDTSVFFTQTHIAEIQTLLRLIDEYGLPNEDNMSDEGMDAIVSGPLQHPMKRLVKTDEELYSALQENKVIKDGSYITYHEVQTGESVDATIHADEYRLHELMVRKKSVMWLI